MANGTGRVEVTRGKQVVTLRLSQWAYLPHAILSIGEVENLIRQLQDAVAQKPAALPDIL